MENKIEISIIVAAYNIENYIEKCLNSLLNQNFEKNYEIIAINDGSTDNTLEILKKYEIKNDKIRVINQKNQGLSQVRNRGIKESKGEFICFIDGDDYVEKTYLKDMYDTLKKENVDLIVSGFFLDFNGKKEKDKRFTENIKLNSLDGVKYIFKDKINTAVWNKIFKKNIIMENDIIFPEIRGAEDYTFILEYILKIKKLYILDKNLYNYYQREGSLSKVINEDYIINNLKVLLIFIKILNENKLQVKNHMTYFIEKYIYFIRDYKKINIKNNKKELLVLKKELEDTFKNSWIIFNKKLKKKMKIRFFKLKYGRI